MEQRKGEGDGEGTVREWTSEAGKGITGDCDNAKREKEKFEGSEDTFATAEKGPGKKKITTTSSLARSRSSIWRQLCDALLLWREKERC